MKVLEPFHADIYGDTKKLDLEKTSARAAPAFAGQSSSQWRRIRCGPEGLRVGQLGTPVAHTSRTWTVCS
jgi:hypothetical protein